MMSASTIPTDLEAAARIVALRVEHREALAMPLMSEGSISPLQVHMMGKAARAKWERLRMVRMDVEANIRDLSRPFAVREAEAREQAAKASLSGEHSRCCVAVSCLRYFVALPHGKRGIRPSIKKQIELRRADIRAAIEAHPELAAEFGSWLVDAVKEQA